ncbi:hypothetical protein ACFQMH_27730 [Streptomyces viridiviolaceus]|uniref:Uncharacterized protein n=1 Tax=Streptomyces viridiviolaceus TaxID=68282 RepID=A0ABW2E631_9ACTN
MFSHVDRANGHRQPEQDQPPSTTFAMQLCNRLQRIASVMSIFTRNRATDANSTEAAAVPVELTVIHPGRVSEVL